MYTTLSDSARIAQAQSVFRARIEAASHKSGMLGLGYQGGGRDVQVHSFPSHGIWVGLADSGNRYWNALGVGNPFEGDHTIIAEINPPKSGINRRVSGAFVTDSGTRIYLAHRGRVGGGRKGIGKAAFMDWYSRTIHSVDDGDRTSAMIIIGALDDDMFFENLTDFIRKVAEFREWAVNKICEGEIQ